MRYEDEDRNEFDVALRRVDEILAKLPSRASSSVRAALSDLKSLLVDQRPPRLVILGRRGAGKSSLVNAMLGRPVLATGHVRAQTGAATWQPVPDEPAAFEILDTRGFQEGSAPTERDASKNAVESVVDAIRQKRPDAFLFVVKAKEVDAAIDADLAALARILRETKKLGGAPPPILGVVTQCDELEPKNVPLHDPDRSEPRDYDEKLDHVRAAVSHLEAKLRPVVAAEGSSLLAVLGVAAYMSFRTDGSMRADERWQIDTLVRYVSLEMPKDAIYRLVRETRIPELAKKVAGDLTDVVAAACAAVAATPIPVADILPITTLQVGLVTAIAYVSGRVIDRKAALEFLAAMGVNVGAAYALREVVRATAKLVPVAGEVLSATVAFAGTQAIGRAAITYFIEGRSAREAKETLERMRRVNHP